MIGVGIKPNDINLKAGVVSSEKVKVTTSFLSQSYYLLCFFLVEILVKLYSFTVLHFSRIKPLVLVSLDPAQKLLFELQMKFNWFSSVVHV